MMFFTTLRFPPFLHGKIPAADTFLPNALTNIGGGIILWATKR
jgi:hypothetical protein